MQSALRDAPSPGASPLSDAEPTEASGLTPVRLAMIALVVITAGTFLAQAATGAISGLSALWLIHGVGIPLLLLAYRPRWARVLVPVVLIVAVALTGRFVVQRIVDPPSGQLAGHDGGVWVTRAAADDVVAGENPYSSDFQPDLPEVWHEISVDGETSFANPIFDVYPYLPGAFLLIVPASLLAGSSDVADPRLVMLATYVLSLVLIARRRDPAWSRVAALVASSGPLVWIHLAYGTNDTWSASLVVIAALVAARRPRLAGVVLALAISVKFLVALAVVPFGIWVWRRGGAAALRRWWTLPATLVATCLPFFVTAPSDMVGDTVLFWSGRNDDPFPTSGFGLPAVAPGVFHGPLLGLTTVVLAIAGLAGAAWLARRVDHPGVLPVATAVAVVGVLIPARTFQGNYLVAVAGMLATGWLVLGARLGEVPDTTESMEREVHSRDAREPGLVDSGV